MPHSTAMVDARTRDLVDRDLHSLWHPFTQHSLWAADDPLVIDRGEGVWLYDNAGKRYFDGMSSLWVTTHGHGEPAINAAIQTQLSRLDHSTFLGFTHEPGILLAEELLRIAPPGLSRVFYAGDGASAVEAALKMAFQAAAQRGEYRPHFVHLAEAYHGDTLGAVSVSGIDVFHATYRPIMLKNKAISSPGVLQPGQSRSQRAAEVVAELRVLFEQSASDICAVIVEPMVQAAAGMITHDAEFLRGVRELCTAYGVTMIADEVATGLGSTGEWWAVQHADVAPDLLACGKRLSGGYLPISAVLATEHIYEAFLGSVSSGRTFFHGHTYTANPICCAASLANLQLMHERSTVDRSRALGASMAEMLTDLASYDGVREIRQLGVMVGIDVESVTERTGFAVCRRARSKGVLIRPIGDVVILMPPLCTTDTELKEFIGVVDESVRDIVQ